MRTRIIGQEFIELDTVDSTNKYAAELLTKKKAAHGTVILAHEQTMGRGQRGRIWRTSKGLDIATSVVLVPIGLVAQEQFVLSKIAALAVHDVVAEAMLVSVGRSADRVRIKWPNDVLVDRRKVAGILISNEVLGGQVISSVLGIGINVNSSDLDADFNATSLRMETGIELDRMRIVEHLCQRLEHWLDIHATSPQPIHAKYAELLWHKGRFTDFELDGLPFSARPMDVDPEGRLMVEDENGAVKAYGLERLRFGTR
ncbi:MAG: biotin--[acetyl-CoA-carboxylase] ligase [Flavobacteriales bacterium]|nr:biotin--[acetyl-CoA-carboxylase] ligase [Flavobacteriales bacterium]MBL0043610.1 biotin--[acetyl-CoA-carboxylase] ligase [Flavobacteriales bacterium]